MNSNASASSVLLGALLCLALQILFGVLGSAIGLSTIPVEKLPAGEISPGQLSIGAGIFIFVTIIISFFIGGLVTSLLAGPRPRLLLIFHAGAMWGLVCLSVLVFIGSKVISGIGTLIQQAGIGVAATSGIEAMIEQVDRLNPRIVTDMELMKGKAVSRIVLDRPKKNFEDEFSQNLSQELRSLEKESGGRNKTAPTHEVGGVGVEDAREVTATASWIAFFALIISAIASMTAPIVVGLSRIGRNKAI